MRILSSIRDYIFRHSSQKQNQGHLANLFLKMISIFVCCSIYLDLQQMPKALIEFGFSK